VLVVASTFYYYQCFFLIDNASYLQWSRKFVNMKTRVAVLY